MTTPAPPVTTGSFQGVAAPRRRRPRPEPAHSGRAVQRHRPDAVPDQPARRWRSRPRSRTARPGWARWTRIPVIGLNDDADIVAICKLASIVLLSQRGRRRREREHDQRARRAHPRSASIELDRGILYGTRQPRAARGRGRRAARCGRRPGRRADHRGRLDRRCGRRRVPPVRPAVRAGRPAQRAGRQRAAALPGGARRRVRPDRGRRAPSWPQPTCWWSTGRGRG